MKKLIIAALLTTAFSNALADEKPSSSPINNSASASAGASADAYGVGLGFATSSSSISNENRNKTTVTVATEGNNSSNTATNSGNNNTNAATNSGNNNTNAATNSGNNSTNAATNSGNNSTNASSGNTTTVFGDTYQAPRIPVASAWSAPLAVSNGTCMGSSSGGAQGAGFGFSIASTWNDLGCDRRYNAQMLNQLGARRAAVALMCQDASVREAMKTAGTPCQ